MARIPSPPPEVAAALDDHPARTRKRLREVRKLILDTAAETPGVGRIEETLKWGQPSYLTPETRSGSTVRLGAPKDDDGAVAVYFHCGTDLVTRFRERYPEDFRFEGNRALHLPANGPLPVAALRHCIALALTYHARKQAGA